MIRGANQFALIIPSVALGTRPSAGPGVVVTPGNNAYGSYTEIMAGAAVTHAVYGIWINIHSGLASSQARDLLVTLGIDRAGGTSYTDWILHLSGSCSSLRGGSSTGFSGGGVSYYFEVRLPAGCSIAAKASVNNATVGTVRVMCEVYCKPSRPDLLDIGSFVDTFGATPASSSGTPVVPGTTDEGAWVELGTLTRPLKWWEFGFCINDGVFAGANTYNVDIAIGDASNKQVIIQDAYVETTIIEAIIKHEAGVYWRAAIGDKVYGRVQVGPNAADDNVSLIVYGVG